MSTYRAGQRVRIEWPNGDALEGTLAERPFDGLQATLTGPTTRIWMPIDVVDGRTITILAEPRPEEPTGLGSVVEAACVHDEDFRRTWVRLDEVWVSAGWVGPPPAKDGADDWDSLIDPVVLHAGWEPA
jgi:hypothetical protein